MFDDMDDFDFEGRESEFGSLPTNDDSDDSPLGPLGGLGALLAALASRDMAQEHADAFKLHMIRIAFLLSTVLDTVTVQQVVIAYSENTLDSLIALTPEGIVREIREELECVESFHLPYLANNTGVGDGDVECVKREFADGIITSTQIGGVPVAWQPWLDPEFADKPEFDAPKYV